MEYWVIIDKNNETWQEGGCLDEILSDYLEYHSEANILAIIKKTN